MCESVTPPTPSPRCQYVKRCLCASRRHLRALWESRVNEASMIFFFLQIHTHIQYDAYTHTRRCRCCYFAFISCLKVQKKQKKKTKQPSGKYVMLSFEKLSKGKKRVETPRHEFPQVVITALTASWCMWISVERLRRASLCSVCVCVEHVHAFVTVSFSFLWRIKSAFSTPRLHAL